MGLVDDLRVRHKVCMCLTTDGSTHGLGKPMRCIKKGNHLIAMPKGMELRECVIGCDHLHLYSTEYLQRLELFDQINRLGIKKVIALLKESG